MLRLKSFGGMIQTARSRAGAEVLQLPVQQEFRGVAQW